MESWIEVNLVPAEPMDESLLTGLVDDLVHAELLGEVETWFFFWEPELRLRLRWVDPSRAEQGRARLAARLDRSRAEGALLEWYEGAHGRRGERYGGEADMYGEEVWPLVQKDWMNGSEYALLLARLEQAGALSQPRDFHWKRHVHLFSNQLFGTWNAEVELCLAQAPRVPPAHPGAGRSALGAGERADRRARRAAAKPERGSPSVVLRKEPLQFVAHSPNVACTAVVGPLYPTLRRPCGLSVGRFQTGGTDGEQLEAQGERAHAWRDREP